MIWDLLEYLGPFFGGSIEIWSKILLSVGGLLAAIFSVAEFKRSRKINLQTRLSQALQMLDSNRMSVREGAILLLWNLGAEMSKFHRSQIAAVIEAFVRDVSSARKEGDDPTRYRDAEMGAWVSASMQKSADRRAELKDCNFRNLTLEKHKFHNVDFTNSSFEGAILCRSEFVGSCLLGATFKGADIKGTVFGCISFSPTSSKSECEDLLFDILKEAKNPRLALGLSDSLSKRLEGLSSCTEKRAE